MVNKKCKWEYLEFEEAYETSCDEMFCLYTGTLKENKIKYCPFCGNKIKCKLKESEEK